MAPVEETPMLLGRVDALPKTTGTAYNGDVSISFTTYGDGEPMLFLHGFPDTPLTWASQILEFARDHLVIVPALRGFPPSSAPREPARYDMGELAGDVQAVLDALRVDRVTLVGHDWGGVVLQAVALFFPDRVKGIALLNAPVLRPFLELLASDPVQQALSGYTLEYQSYAEGDAIDLDHVVRNIRDPWWRRHVRDYLEGSPLTGMLSYYKLNYPAPPYRLPSSSDRDTFVSSLPALIVFGKDDPYFSVYHLASVWEWFTGPVRLTLIPGAGHWVHQDAPDAVNAELRSWLAFGPGA